MSSDKISSNKNDIPEFVEESRSILQDLSNTLKLGEQTRSEQSIMIQAKKEKLEKLRDHVKKSMEEIRELRTCDRELNSTIVDLRIEIKEEQTRCLEKLCLLEALTKKLGENKVTPERLELIETIEEDFLANIMNQILVLKDDHVRPCRNDPKDLLDSVDERKTDEIAMNSAAKFKKLIAEATYLIKQIDLKHKEANLQRSNEQEIHGHDRKNTCENESNEDNLLSLIESLAFDYRKLI